MISRRFRSSGGAGALQGITHPWAIALAVVLAGVAAFGWLASPIGLAVAIGVELIVGGLGAVWILGPIHPALGFARYATPAVAGVAITLFGRILFDSTGLLLSPVAALLIWAVIWTEIRAAEAERAGLAVDLALVGIVFASTAGVENLVGPEAWPPGLVLLALLLAVPIVRAAEARGQSGVWAVGQSALHLLAVLQVAAALLLLQPPGVLGPALVALAYHAWGSAAAGLEAGEPGWRVGVEIGLLALMGLVLAIFVVAR